MSKYKLTSWNEIESAPKSIVGDTIYCALYNKEPAIVRIKDGQPVFVQFIDNSRIFKASGITKSSIELLLTIKN